MFVERLAQNIMEVGAVFVYPIISALEMIGVSVPRFFSGFLCLSVGSFVLASFIIVIWMFIL